jgi:hypothetical protein
MKSIKLRARKDREGGGRENRHKNILRASIFLPSPERRKEGEDGKKEVTLRSKITSFSFRDFSDSTGTNTEAVSVK